MKLRKKALLPAIAMVLASVIALSGVTYAWFTTGNTAEVAKLDVNVATASGIQVSLDASSWKSTITATDIKNAITNASAYSARVIQLPEGEISPVSSAGIVADGKLQMFFGEYNKDGSLRSVAEVEQNRTSGGNFIAFDLFFKATTAQDLTMRTGDSQSYVTGINLAEKDENGEYVATSIGTEKAVRVAFLDLGYAATPDAARALKAVNNTLIWEPNSGTRADGVEADSGKLDYKGFKTKFDSGNGTEDEYVAAVTTFDGEQVIVKLQPGINKVRVYIWLEGQDVDCINNISFGDFRVNLYFDVPAEEG